MQLLFKMLSQFTWLGQQQIFSDKFLILKFLFNELQEFFSSSEKLFFQVQVRQNNRVFTSLSSQPWYTLYRRLLVLPNFVKRKWLVLVLHYVTPIKRIREQRVIAHLLFFIF